MINGETSAQIAHSAPTGFGIALCKPGINPIPVNVHPSVPRPAYTLTVEPRIWDFEATSYVDFPTLTRRNSNTNSTRQYQSSDEPQLTTLLASIPSTQTLDLKQSPIAPEFLRSRSLLTSPHQGSPWRAVMPGPRINQYRACRSLYSG